VHGLPLRELSTIEWARNAKRMILSTGNWGALGLLFLDAVADFKKLADDVSSQSPHIVTAILVEIDRNLLAAVWPGLDSAVRGVDEEVERRLEDLGDFFGADLVSVWEWYDTDDRRDDMVAHSHDIIEFSKNLNTCGLDSDLFIGFAKSRFADPGISGFESAAGKGNLAFVRGHGIGSQGEQEMYFSGPFEERDENSGRSTAVLTDSYSLARGQFGYDQLSKICHCFDSSSSSS